MSESPPPVPEQPTAARTAPEPGGQRVDDGRGRIFPCEECGADLEFHIPTQGLKCPFCGHEKRIEPAEGATIAEQDFRAMLARLEELRKAGTEPELSTEQSEVHCESCGANVVFLGTLTSLNCPYCGSPIQLENVHAAGQRIPVDAVLTFQVPKEKAQANLTAWIQSLWFAPNEFRKKGIEGRLNGVYLPFWTYDALTATRYTGQRGEHYTVTVGMGKDRRTERRTRWYPAAGEFQRFFDDLVVLAAKGEHRGLAQKIDPWPLRETQPFKQEFLAGFFSRTYDVPLDDGFIEAKGRIEEAIEADVRSRIGGDVQRVDTLDIHYGALSFKHILLPTWLLAYRFHGEVYQVMINAATGEVQGERPYSWVKIASAVLLGIIAVAVVVGLTSS
ncbi:MAG: hypothetical protein AB7O26_07540 [Planctomycetaceae bacterium]